MASDHFCARQDRSAPDKAESQFRQHTIGSDSAPFGAAGGKYAKVRDVSGLGERQWTKQHHKIDLVAIMTLLVAGLSLRECDNKPVETPGANGRTCVDSDSQMHSNCGQNARVWPKVRDLSRRCAA